ncbi:MAG: T9SS type A sorting domain-containing protein, partial [Bacteroidales bacterium]|nr:T9SS type A sorting domain-containing protein [Candidatus Scybalousia scybalohippi]
EIYCFECMNNYVFSGYNSGLAVQAIVEDNDSVSVAAYAQPMYASTPTALKSIVYPGESLIVDLFNEYPQISGYYPDSNYTYFQIWDSTLTNLIYQVNYDSVYKNAVANYSTLFQSGAMFLREIVFDSSIVVQGKFYVVLTFDTSYRPERMRSQYETFFNSALTLAIINKIQCEDYDEKYPHLMLKLEGTNEWIYPEDIDTSNFTSLSFNYIWTDYYKPMRTLLVFPKIDTAFDWATWNAQNSALNEIQEREKQINVFPNPAKDKITIESATELESIEIKNILGITQQSLKVKGNKVTIPISDLEKGTYLVSIRTSEGNHTKKIVKE